MAAVAQQPNGPATVALTNIGGFAVPVDLRVAYADGSTETVHATPAIWQANQKQAVVTIPTKKAVKSVELQPGVYMEADTKNDKFDVK